MEWGFGSPSSFADNTGETKPVAPSSAYFDHGFGTPTLTQLVAATATFTLSDKPAEGATITITDADGTSITFEVDNENNGVSGSNVALNGISGAGGGAAGTAADLVAKGNGQSTLDVVFSNPSAGVVVMTQGTKGVVGNKNIAVSSSTVWNNACSVNVPTGFTEGVGNSVTAVTLDKNNFDTGFGSPYFVYQAEAQIQLTLSAIANPLPDNGGVAVALSGEIPYLTENIQDPDDDTVILKTVYPIKARVFGTNNQFFNQYGKVVAAETSAAYLNSPVAGSGTDLQPLHPVLGKKGVGQLTYFILPPLPPGTYNIKLYYGPTGGETTILTDALRVVRRNRSKATYRMRSNVPELLKTGPISMKGEQFFKGGFS